MLGVLHAGIGLATSSPEIWALTEDEARELATAAVPVLDQFEWMPDPKYAAIGGLLIVCGKVYIPRVTMSVQKGRAEKSRQTRSAPQPVAPQPLAPNVTPLNTGFSNFGDPTVN